MQQPAKRAHLHTRVLPISHLMLLLLLLLLLLPLQLLIRRWSLNYVSETHLLSLNARYEFRQTDFLMLLEITGPFHVCLIARQCSCVWAEISFQDERIALNPG